MLNGLKGRTAQLLTVDQREVLINAETDGDEHGKILTVLLRSDQVNSTSDIVKAEIQFGSDGFQATAIVDFLNGYAFPVAASRIRVVAFGTYFLTPAARRVGAYVVEGGSHFDNLPMTNLFPAHPGFVSVGIGAFVSAKLPPFIGKIKAFTGDPANDSYRIDIVGPGAFRNSVDIAAGAGKLSTGDWIEVTTPSSVARITNTGPAAIASLSLWGALKLG